MASPIAYDAASLTATLVHNGRFAPPRPPTERTVDLAAIAARVLREETRAAEKMPPPPLPRAAPVVARPNHFPEAELRDHYARAPKPAYASVAPSLQSSRRRRSLRAPSAAAGP